MIFIVILSKSGCSKFLFQEDCAQGRHRQLHKKQATYTVHNIILCSYVLATVARASLINAGAFLPIRPLGVCSSIDAHASI